MFRTKWPPESMENLEQEDTAAKLFEKLDVEIESSNIEDLFFFL